MSVYDTALIDISPELPPDPVTVAPPLDTSVATTLATATEFLYTGSDPIQTGVAPGTIEARRAAVLRGRALTREENPLSGVNITILSHPEFGSTMSREDGMFDMAVNGGGLLTVNYEKAGYLTVQRQVQTPWQDYVWLPDVVMIQVDANVTAIDLYSSAPIQVARGSQVNDIDGTRQATLLFPQGVQVNMTLSDGTTQALTTLHVRATEYTVGANGPQAMPAQLPPQSGYTYAVDLTIDEAMAKGASDVRFDKPVYAYVENFLNFPVGGIVPVGYYNRSLGQWIPSDNGRIIKILSITGGVADLDVNGSNLLANASQLEALNITDAERQQLASLYQQGQSLWRVPIIHFSPWDCNYPYGPPPDAQPPKQPPPKRPPPKDCEKGGSIIGCQNQWLGETVNIIGTPFSLHYKSDRVPGRKEAYILDIPLSGASMPASAKRIDLEVLVAGNLFTQNFSAAPNLTYTINWNSKDVYGRKTQGIQPVTVRIGYVYDGVYMTPAQQSQAFAEFGTSLMGSRSRFEFSIWQVLESEIGVWDARGQGLEAWTLDIHHVYNPVNRVLYLGDGNMRSVQSVGQTITTVAGNPIGGYSGDRGSATQARLYQPGGIAVGPEGSVYIADSGNNRIRRVGTDGIITTVAGNGNSGCGGNGISATNAALKLPDDVAVSPDGSLYISNGYCNAIRRVGTDGIITTVSSYNGRGIEVGPDGSLYFVDGTSRVRRLGTNGIITVVAGDGNYRYRGDGGPATQASLNSPSRVAVGTDGSIYIAESSRIRRVGTDGIITTVAGNGTYGYSGDGGPATQAQIGFARGIAVGRDSSIYIADDATNYGSDRIRRVGADGIITTVAGNGNLGYSGDGGPATQARIGIPWDISVGPDDSIYIDFTYDNRIRRVTSALPGFSTSDFVILSEDSSEIYAFNSSGRHLRTLDALSGAVKYNFTYDSAGRLNNITDVDGNVVTIERDASGNATAIISPYGQRTSLSLDANGYLSSITDPAGESTILSYAADGLLTNMTDPRGKTHNFSYDTIGRLIRDEDPAGGFKILNRTDIANGYLVKLSTGLNRNTTYQAERLSTGDLRLVNTFPNGFKTETVIGTNGSQTITYPDGTLITQVTGPDPRFGMQAPVLSSLTVKTPSGFTQTTTGERTAMLDNPNDPLSLKSLSDTSSINSRTYTSIFNAYWKNFTTNTPSGRKIFTTIDNKGRIADRKIPGIVSVNYTYDARGRLSTTTQGTRIYAFSYDVQGNLANITDPLSRTVGFEYDTAGRVTRQNLPNGRQIRYNYDANGNILSISPPGRPKHDFNYTPVDIIEDYIPPDLGLGPVQTHYTYNIDRQLTRVTQPDGAAVDLGYDSVGRLSTITYPQGTTRMAYDPSTGNLKNITAPDGGKITYAYDGNLLTDTNWSGAISGSIRRSYDNNFSVISESINGANAVNFKYDMDGLLTRAGLLNLSRDPQNGLLNGTSLENVTDKLSYNSFGEIAAYQAISSGTNLFSVNFTRDDIGRIIQKDETIDGAIHIYKYTYDLAGRLIEVRKDGTMISQYVYDANGNRLSYTSLSGTISGTYDNQDRLLQYGTTTYTYTANGELLSKINGSQTTTYQYDVLGNLRNVTLPDGTQIEYLIDGQNRRIGKKVNSTMVQGFLYKDQLNPIAELDGSGNIVSRFIYAGRGNSPDYIVKGGATYRIISDHLGSPRLVVDVATGQIVQRIDYYEFGNVMQDTNSGFQPFGFTGGLHDSQTGLIHFGARDYDSKTGRWTTKDVLGLSKGINLYAYVDGDPINRIDPEGMDWLNNLADLSAGIGDKLTSIPFTDLSLTRWIRNLKFVREWIDPNKVIDPCSDAYKAGEMLVYLVKALNWYDWLTKPLYPAATLPSAPYIPTGYQYKP